MEQNCTHPRHHNSVEAYHDVQALSRVGRCQTFEASADGYGRGEGIAVLLLGASEAGDAEPNHSCMAILHGSAVNQDGR